jgi:hypothetical protein
VKIIHLLALLKIDQAANQARRVSAPWEKVGLPGDSAGIERCND